jgi:hypothetical protein
MNYTYTMHVSAKMLSGVKKISMAIFIDFNGIKHNQFKQSYKLRLME